jgi:hypothetical protein
MFKKKLFALAMATVMTLSTSVVAFAATPSTIGEADANTNTTVYNFSASATALQAGDVTASGSVQQPQIKVTVPTSNSYVINPYQLKVKVPDAARVDGSDSATESQAQIISPSYTVSSDSDVALKVNLAVKGTPSTGVTLTTSTIAANDSKKDILLYVNFDVTTPAAVSTALSSDSEIFNADGTLKDKTSFTEGETVYAIDKSQIVKGTDGYKLADGVKGLIANPSGYVETTTAKTATVDSVKVNYTLVTYKFLGDGDYDSKAANQVAVTTAATTKTAIASLDANTGDNMSATYSFMGKTATNPTSPWSSDDNVKVTLTFTFTPVVTEVESDS